MISVQGIKKEQDTFLLFLIEKPSIGHYIHYKMFAFGSSNRNPEGSNLDSGKYFIVIRRLFDTDSEILFLIDRI